MEERSLSPSSGSPGGLPEGVPREWILTGDGDIGTYAFAGEVLNAGDRIRVREISADSGEVESLRARLEAPDRGKRSPLHSALYRIYLTGWRKGRRNQDPEPDAAAALLLGEPEVASIEEEAKVARQWRKKYEETFHDLAAARARIVELKWVTEIERVLAEGANVRITYLPGHEGFAGNLIINNTAEPTEQREVPRPPAEGSPTINPGHEGLSP